MSGATEWRMRDQGQWASWWFLLDNIQPWKQGVWVLLTHRSEACRKMISAEEGGTRPNPLTRLLGVSRGQSREQRSGLCRWVDHTDMLVQTWLKQRPKDMRWNGVWSGGRSLDGGGWYFWTGRSRAGLRQLTVCSAADILPPIGGDERVGISRSNVLMEGGRGLGALFEATRGHSGLSMDRVRTRKQTHPPTVSCLSVRLSIRLSALQQQRRRD